MPCARNTVPMSGSIPTHACIAAPTTQVKNQLAGNKDFNKSDIGDRDAQIPKVVGVTMSDWGQS
jgi:hypothetical protein